MMKMKGKIVEVMRRERERERADLGAGQTETRRCDEN